MMVVARLMVVMVAIAMAGQFVFKNNSRSLLKIVMMMRYKGMQHNNRNSQSGHYFCRQIPHNMHNKTN